MTLSFFEYGVSGTPALDRLESHGGYTVHGGFPSVWIVEGVKTDPEMTPDPQFNARMEREFTRHVRAGH